MPTVPSMMNPSARGCIFAGNVPSIVDQVTLHATMQFTILSAKSVPIHENNVSFCCVWAIISTRYRRSLDTILKTGSDHEFGAVFNEGNYQVMMGSRNYKQLCTSIHHGLGTISHESILVKDTRCFNSSSSGQNGRRPGRRQIRMHFLEWKW